MSDADYAYKEAQRLIAAALANNSFTLDFSTKKTRALTKLPPEISDLTEVKELNCDNTQVTDLTPISGMTGIIKLDLNNTQVTDLIPISGMTGIEFLLLDKTKVADLTSIAGMTGMILLSLDNTGVADLSPIAGMTGMTFLSLSNTPVRDLTPIEGITGITALYLTNTRVTDLSPIAAMMEIKTLYLSSSQVADLRPLLSLTKLAEEPESGGLTFEDTSATQMDLKLDELSEITDAEERGTKTFAYLREVGGNWPPIPKTTPDQDTILTVGQTEDGRLDISPAIPDADELTDTVKRKAHQLLQQATKSLEQIAGNMHPRLASSARTLSLHIDCPLDQVDMLDVHFELEALRGTYERRGERKGEDIFGDDVIDALDNVLMIGPGLVLDNEQVEKLEARRDRYRGAPPTPDVQAAQDQLSDGIALDPVLFGDTIRSYSVTFKDGHAEGSERLQAGQGILNKNTVIKVGSSVAIFVAGGMAGGPLSALGNELLAWLVAQSETISVLAPTWGTAFEAWITPIIMHAREANVAARALLKRPD